MSRDDELGRRRSVGTQFSLAALFLLLTACCLAFGLWQATRRDVIVALLEMRFPSSTLPRSAQEHERLTAAQLASFQSPAVLSAALQAPGVSSLPSVSRQSDPASWLRDRLRVSSVADSPILELRLESRRGGGGEDVKILSALIDAQKKAAANAVSGVAPDPTIRVIQAPLVTSH